MLKAHAQRGEIDLVYFDESGFSVNPPNRYAWAPEGDTHAVTPASHQQRFNVLGALRYPGRLIWRGVWGRVDSAQVVGFFNDLARRLRRTTYVVLDNLGTHRSQAFQDRLEYWGSKGLHFCYLPPYSPELNLIEILWKRVKHTWLRFTERTTAAVEADVSAVLNGFGKRYRITFS